MEISLKGFYLFEGLYVELGVGNDRIAPFNSRRSKSQTIGGLGAVLDCIDHLRGS